MFCRLFAPFFVLIVFSTVFSTFADDEELFPEERQVLTQKAPKPVVKKEGLLKMSPGKNFYPSEEYIRSANYRRPEEYRRPNDYFRPKVYPSPDDNPRPDVYIGPDDNLRPDNYVPPEIYFRPENYPQQPNNYPRRNNDIYSFSENFPPSAENRRNYDNYRRPDNYRNNADNIRGVSGGDFCRSGESKQNFQIEFD